MSLQETFIRNLKYYRKQKRLTQNELTLKIDMGLNYINGVEQGTFFPKPDVIDKIATALEIKSVQLFDENKEQPGILKNIPDSTIETITDMLLNKLRPSIHADITNALKGMAQ